MLQVNLNEQQTKSKSAFTLIELLIVVAIIGILAAIAVPNFLNAQVRAKITRVQGDLRAIDMALSSYQVDHNAFPPMRFPQQSYRYPWNTLPINITTPVAYISSAQIQDPFRSGNEVFTRIVENQNAMPYGYNNIQQLIQLGASGFNNADIQAYGAWRLFSAGPNGSLQPYQPYDTSNGLRSCGDILRTQRSAAGLKLGETITPAGCLENTF